MQWTSLLQSGIIKLNIGHVNKQRTSNVDLLKDTFMQS